ncbi:YicC/YloC family endoribonuclease [Metabacillus halosaccharovorans]|uniref:YicC/YloC family endoribonuclease n=1 Tax=Metabacillus halosaccharovorans TaxID=930124 RepID=UPI001C1FA36B|nr:YicC/YloC family endoribonuclease [Metabacillus halosaccharovorans]MBU7592060.1 YicC family protein [Metabacillus halosaccharovorans]
MVRSMTGFGRASGHIKSCLFTVEMKSVNHRFLDIHLKMPKQLMNMEDKIRKLISKSISRGRIEVYINVEGEVLTTKSIQVDWDLIDQYVSSLQQIKSRLSIDEQLSLQHILALDGAIEVQKESVSSNALENGILELVNSAVKELSLMRKVEGEHLAADLNQRLTLLSQINDQLEKFAPIVVGNYQERISNRVAEFISGKLDENRILTEVALFADKADIMEEITRIHSHIQQFRDSLTFSEPIGRKLDFLVQELNREANTIGSKANDSQIAKNVVELKSIIEKLKEQVQNIE